MHENISLLLSCIALAFVIILPFMLMCFLKYNKNKYLYELNAKNDIEKLSTWSI
jgi:hypothetical protein